MRKALLYAGIAGIAFFLVIGCGKDSSTSPSLSSDKDVNAFYFAASKNSALTVDVVADIYDTNIVAIVPSGTDVSALIATFVTDGEAVKISGVAQQSAVTPNNFANPVLYSVVAEDGTTKNYLVTVRVSSATEKSITSFAFEAAKNTGLSTNVTAVISGTSISATVPYGTDVSALVATFSTSGKTVTVAGTVQQSGVTANNFLSAATYTVIAEDGSSQNYAVTVTVASATSKEITSFMFEAAKNSVLSTDVAGAISGNAISATVPFGTNVGALIATYATTGTAVKVGTTAQQSGVTANDFTNAVTYAVEAADSSTQNYTVTVTIAAKDTTDTTTTDTTKTDTTVTDTVNAITAFSFEAAKNAALTADAAATVGDSTIAVTVPTGTDVTALAATFAVSQGSTVKVDTTVQQSGVTVNNFTGPVTYTVVDTNDSSRAYIVTVTIAADTTDTTTTDTTTTDTTTTDTTKTDSSKAITAYSFTATANASLTADVAAAITDTNIAATVPAGTNVKKLVATFTTTGDTVKVGNVVQESGVTENDFSTALAYNVIARDSSTQEYVVTVTVEPAYTIAAFSFAANRNAALSEDVVATITDTIIKATAPVGTDVTALVATFSTLADSVTVAGALQQNNTTANNFTNPVTYTAYSGGQTKNYVVSVELKADTIDILGTWSTAATDTFTLAVTADSVKMLSAADTTVAYIDYFSNADSAAVLQWVNKAGHQFQKIGWEFLSADVIELGWSDYKPHRNAVIGEPTTTKVDTLTKQ